MTKKYALACPTSMGVRITPEDRMAVNGLTVCTPRSPD